MPAPAPDFPAAELLAAALSLTPAWEPPSQQEGAGERAERLAVVAVALDASGAQGARYRLPEAISPRARKALRLATAYQEGWRLDRKTHSGARRGPQGSACFMQIHGGNRLRGRLPLSALVGVDLAASQRCADVGGRTLDFWTQRCWEEGFRTEWRESVVSMYIRPAWGCGGRNGLIRRRAELARQLEATEWVVTDRHVRLVKAVRGETVLRAPAKRPVPNRPRPPIWCSIAPDGSWSLGRDQFSLFDEPRDRHTDPVGFSQLLDLQLGL